MTVVVIAYFTIVLDVSCKVCSHKLFNITAAASDHLNPLSLKHILRTLSHISGKHDHNSHLTKYGSDSALASASFRGSHPADIRHFSVNDIEYRIVSAMTEMIIHASVSCRYRYLHNDLIIVYLQRNFWRSA